MKEKGMSHRSKYCTWWVDAVPKWRKKDQLYCSAV